MYLIVGGITLVGPAQSMASESTIKYKFSLILSGDVSDEGADKLYEAGCDDGSILSRENVTMIQFDRESETLDSALNSAIRDVEQAGFAVARVEIDGNEVPQFA